MTILKTSLLAAAVALVAVSAANAAPKKANTNNQEYTMIQDQASGSRTAQEMLNW
jgi:hypothetical protein